jgi:hypothetical protein
MTKRQRRRGREAEGGGLLNCFGSSPVIPLYLVMY